MRTIRNVVLLLCSAFLIGGAPAVKDRATPERLGGVDRFLTSVSTDKPIYKVGDTVLIRGVVLNAFTHAPAGGNGTVQIKGPKGELLGTLNTATVDGSFGTSWRVPEGAAGGAYEIVAQHVFAGTQAPASRKFDVRVYRPPRVKTQIKFERDGYGPGNRVSATLEATRAEGGIPVRAKVVAVARVDEKEIARIESTVDATGHVTVGFPLPTNIERGEGTLAFTIDDGGAVETAAKTIPILMQSVDVAVYPEGGALIEGLVNRVYLEARTPSKKPADIVADVVDANGAKVARVTTEHEGRGRFTLTPVKGARYSLQIVQPAGIKKAIPLPQVVADGALISSLDDVTPADRNVRVRVAFTGDRMVNVTLSQRERLLDTVKLDASKQRGTEVTLKTGEADGVLVATVSTTDGVPLAERIVFRKPRKTLGVELSADRERYSPGEVVKLTVKTTLDGKPAPAVVGLTVTDDSVLEMIERREQAPSLMSMVFLENDVAELADARVYFDPKNANAARDIDLLLGTQGWRRFAWVSVNDFLASHADRARRTLALVNPPPRPIPTADFGGMGRGMAFGGAQGAPHVAAPPAAAFAPVPEDMPGRKLAAAPPAPPPMPAAGPPAPVMAAGKLEAIQEPQELGEREMVFADEAPMRRRRAQVNFVMVREFAHQVRPDRKPNDRLDFAETLYWSAGVKTDANGIATVTFGTSDSVTSFTASAGGWNTTGAIGAAEKKLDSVQAFYVEPKLPLEVTTGDLIRLPIAVINGTTETISGVQLKLTTKGDVRFSDPAAFDLTKEQRARKIVDLNIGAGTSTANLTLTASGGTYKDVVTRELSVKPLGFPVEDARGGLLEKNGKVTLTFEIPRDAVKGSFRSNLAVFPSPLANLTEALSRMIQEPSGCFEQTSSTTYPMTMAMQYFQSHSGVDQALVNSAKEKLDRGYKRLVGFECKENGYEWFGQDPGHEALTAYGLLQFNDMSRVRQVDTEMVARTREWLLKQRDGKGGFERKRRALHTWVEDRDTSDAYITWAIAESNGTRELKSEVEHLKSIGRTSKNSYVIAIIANVMLKAGDSAEAKSLMQKLAAQQDEKTGLVKGATGSIVGSMGPDLDIETTSFAVLAWLREASFTANVERSIKGLAESCKGGRYGSTQSTVLALRAILAYDQKKAASRLPGKLSVAVDGRPVGAPASFDAKTEGALKLPDISELLSAGKHTVEISMEGGSSIPYSVALRYHRVKPETAPDAMVSFDVKLPSQQLEEGAVVEASARVVNVTDKQIPTVVAIVGLPGGLEPRHDQLKELVKQKTIDAYEVMGRDVVLYWRGMTPKQEVRVPVSAIAAIPGKFTGPASRAYLYYADGKKVWSDGLTVNITPKAQ